MLSRVGNDLFWMGRYLERTDHIARYMKVNYFTSLDAPNVLSNSRKFVLESILYMVGSDYNGAIEESDVLFFAGLDPDHGNSILSTLTTARKNAMGTRHLISTELWEAINKYYHFVANYSPDVFTQTGLYDLTTRANENCSLIRNKVIRTLLHDEVFLIIMLGMYVERALQITRIIHTKRWDVERIRAEQPDAPNQIYEWATLLRCCEAFDMSKKHYKKIPDKWEAVEFMVLNRINPKSIVYCLGHIDNFLLRISGKNHYPSESVEFQSGKFFNAFRYITIDDISQDLEGFLHETLESIQGISSRLEYDYLSV